MTSVVVNNLSVEFPVYDASAKSIRHAILKHAAGATLSVKNSHVVVKALRSVSFQFGEGSRVALIGRNGSGKSTLLKAMAGIYPPASGFVQVNGAITPLFNMALGMDLEATGYENIRTCGLLWGMSHKQVRDAAPSIAKFSELGEYLDIPVRTYSAGMVARLAFSIATAGAPGILMIDEGIGAGDSHFQMKAFNRIHQMTSDANMVFIALHATEVLRSFCNKAIWLHAGEIMAWGDFEEVVLAYEKFENTAIGGSAA